MRKIRTFLIAIDGLDGVGKSTFSESLFKFFKEKLSDTGIVIIKQHFPVYTNDTGKKIKEFLEVEADLSDDKKVDKMIQYQIMNRAEWWVDLRKQLEYYIPEDGHMDDLDVIIIADRYMESNIIYNAFGNSSNNMQLRAAHIREIESAYPQIVPNIQILAYCDPRLQMKRLSTRKYIDRYEKADVVKTLNDNYCQYITWYDNHNDKCILRHCIPMHWFDTQYVMEEYSDEDQKKCKKLKESIHKILLYNYGIMTDKLEICKSLNMNNKEMHELMMDLELAYRNYANTAKLII